MNTDHLLNLLSQIISFRRDAPRLRALSLNKKKLEARKVN
jgi:hypothetical protein